MSSYTQTSGSGHEQFSSQRQFPRLLVSVPVTLRRFLPGGPRNTCGLSLEVSQRGMSAVVCGAPPVGETVVISLPLPGAPFAGLAVVRYSSATCCGFEFLSMTAEVKARIKAWIEELQGQQYPPYSYLRAALTGVSSDS